MKKYLLFCALLFILFFSEANAMMVERHRTGYYYFLGDSTYREIYLYENLETHMPIFMVNYGEDVRGLEMQEIDSLSIDEDAMVNLKNLITILMDHRTFSQMDSYYLVGMQVLIWDYYRENQEDNLKYSFSVAHALIDYRNDYLNALPTYFDPEEYDYKGVVGEKLNVTFWKNLPEDCTIQSFDGNTYTKKDTVYEFQFAEEGDHRFQLRSTFFDEEIHFYKENSIEFIEVTKPKEKDVFLNFHITPKEREAYPIVLMPREGVLYSMQDLSSFGGEEVLVRANVSEGYENLSWKVTTFSGKDVPVINGRFQMPFEGVIVEGMANKKKDPVKYSLFVRPSSLIHFSLDSVSEAGQRISLPYELDENYLLRDLEVYTVSGKKVLVSENSFLMPEEDIVVLYSLEEKKMYHVSIVVREGVSVTLEKDTYQPGDVVTPQILLEDGFTDFVVHVSTVSNEPISFDGSFLMPEEDVILDVTCSKVVSRPNYHLFFLDSPYVHFSIPLTEQEGNRVFFQYDLEEDYQLDSLQIYTTRGEEVSILNNSFLMPDSDIVLFYDVKKMRASHKVRLVNESNVDISLERDSYYPKEVVTLPHSLKYILQMESGERVLLDQEEFLMPNEDVILIAFQEEMPEYSIFWEPRSEITWHFPSNPVFQEEIPLQYNLKEGYQLKNVRIYTNSGEVVPIINQTFSMPDESVILLYDIEEEAPHYQTYFVPQTKKNGCFVLLLILLFIGCLSFFDLLKSVKFV